MNASDRLHDKVLSYAHAEIHSILVGAANPQFHYDQLIGMLRGFVHCGILSQDEADSVASDARAALANSLQNVPVEVSSSQRTGTEPDKT